MYQGWLRDFLAMLSILMLGIILGIDWYRMHHEQPIEIHNYIPQCGNK